MLRAYASCASSSSSRCILSAFLIQITLRRLAPAQPHLLPRRLRLPRSPSAALLALERIPAEANAGLQILGDLFVVTGLVWISGGPDSSFTFLYLAAVAAGAILLGRRGGLSAAGLAAVFYTVLLDLMYFGVLTPDATARAIWAGGDPRRKRRR